MSALSIQVIYVGLFVYAAISDIRHYIIPNWLVIALLALFGISFAINGFNFDAILPNLIAAAITLAVGFTLFAVRSLGGGDVKLISVAVLWLGVDGLARFFLTMSLLGAALSLGLIALVLLKRQDLKLGARWKAAFKTKLPYGVAIAIGAIIAHPMTSRLINF